MNDELQILIKGLFVLSSTVPEPFLYLDIINFSLSKKVVIGWWASEQCADDIIQHNNKSRLQLIYTSFPPSPLYVIADALLDRPDVAGPGAPGDRLPLHPLLLLQLHHAQAETGAR